MASPLMIMAAGEEYLGERQDQMKQYPPFLFGSDDHLLFHQVAENQNSKPEPELTGKQTGKKPLKPAKKRHPQRGMGVAQLERLRLQEHWRKIASETNNPLIQSLTVEQAHYLDPDTPLPVPPLPPPPSQFGSSQFGSSQFAPPPPPPDNYGVCLNRDSILRRFGRGGVVGGGGSVHGFSGVNGLLFDRSSHMDPYKNAGAPDSRYFRNGNELSSIQKMQSFSDYNCDVCYKKKRSSAENVGFMNREREPFLEAIPFNSSDFIGLDNDGNINGDNHNQINGFNPKPSMANPNLDAEVEIMAVHRKESSVKGGGNLVMEYEFLPNIPSSTLFPHSLGGSSSSTSNGAAIDLSLKL